MKAIHGIIGLAALALTSIGAAEHGGKPAAGHGGPHWGYTGAGAPDKWGSLSPDYAACAHGRRQSPIDIGRAEKVPLQKLKIHWVAGEYEIVNNGHSIQATAPAGSMLTIGDKSYHLLQLHFHAPSEHTYLGRSLPMEVHFVHREHGGNGLAVIGVFLDDDGYNPAFSEIMARAPAEGEKPVKIKLDPTDLLPASTAYWTYEGSLTTPPCSEIVRWIVLKEMVSIDKASTAHFKALYPMNARPTQDINDREIFTAH